MAEEQSKGRTTANPFQVALTMNLSKKQPLKHMTDEKRTRKMFLLLQSVCFFLFIIWLGITVWSSVFPGETRHTSGSPQCKWGILVLVETCLHHGFHYNFVLNLAACFHSSCVSSPSVLLFRALFPWFPINFLPIIQFVCSHLTPHTYPTAQPHI